MNLVLCCKMIRSPLTLLFCFCLNTMVSKGAEVDEKQIDDAVRERAISIIRQIADYRHIQITGTVTRPSTLAEATIEFNDPCVWIKYYINAGSDEKQRKEDREVNEAVAKILGSGKYSFQSFDGARIHSYSKLEARSFPNPDPKIPPSIIMLCPENWIRVQSIPLDVMKFEHILQDRTNTTSELVDKNTILRIKRIDNFEAYKQVTLDVLVESGLVKGYKLEGGLLDYESELEWGQSEGHWFPKKGIQRSGSKMSTEWNISAVKFDPGLLRSDYSLDSFDLPLGTRISVSQPASKNPDVSFVGGDDGQKEYEMRMAANKLRKRRQ